jgi:hypothetical protein
MTEFLIACLVLIPLFLAMPLLGKYLDINASAVQGARYVAWERTVWNPADKSNARLENELRNRVFTAVGEPVRPGDGAAPPAGYNPFWRDPEGKPMLASYADVSAHTEASPGQTTPGLIYSKVTSTLVDIFNTVMDWLEAIGGVRQAQFEIDVKGMYSGTLGVGIAEQGTSAQASRMPTLLHVDPIQVVVRPNVIVTDTWTVSGLNNPDVHHCTSDQDAMSELCQVAPLVPTTALSGWFNTLTHIVGKVIPEFARLDYGHLQSGVVPQDRQP